MNLFALILGITCCSAMFLSALAGVFLILVLLPLAFIRLLHPIYRHWVQLIVGSWNAFAMGILRYIHRVEIKSHGDRILPADRAIIIMNHRTSLDWYYFGSPIATYGCLFQLKIALKRSLASIPGTGWSMQLNPLLFLNRQASLDLPHVSKYLTYLSKFSENGFKLLIFPEGTILYPDSKAKSDRFADKNSLPRYDFVLHPRHTGFELMINKLKELDSIDAVYDMTVAYEGPFPTFETALVTGALPKKVHFFTKRYSIAEVNAEGPSNFLSRIWAEKEKFLEHFYQAPKPQGGTSEGLFASFFEIFSCLIWTFYTMYFFVFLLPAYWYIILIVIVIMVIWSDFAPNSIDKTIINSYVD